MVVQRSWEGILSRRKRQLPGPAAKPSLTYFFGRNNSPGMVANRSEAGGSNEPRVQDQPGRHRDPRVKTKLTRSVGPETSDPREECLGRSENKWQTDMLREVLGGCGGVTCTARSQWAGVAAYPS